MLYKRTPYILTDGVNYLVFDTEKDACEYLGVSKCTVASCGRRHTKCRGYTVIKGISEESIYMDKRLHSAKKYNIPKSTVRWRINHHRNVITGEKQTKENKI